MNKEPKPEEPESALTDVVPTARADLYHQTIARAQADARRLAQQHSDMDRLIQRLRQTVDGSAFRRQRGPKGGAV